MSVRDILNAVGYVLTGCTLLLIAYILIRARIERELEEASRFKPNFLNPDTVRRIGLTLANAHCKADKLKDDATRKAWTEGYIEAMTDTLLTIGVEVYKKDGVITVDGRAFPIPEKEMFPL